MGRGSGTAGALILPTSHHTMQQRQQQQQLFSSVPLPPQQHGAFVSAPMREPPAMLVHAGGGGAGGGNSRPQQQQQQRTAATARHPCSCPPWSSAAGPHAPATTTTLMWAWVRCLGPALLPPRASRGREAACPTWPGSSPGCRVPGGGARVHLVLHATEAALLACHLAGGWLCLIGGVMAVVVLGWWRDGGRLVG